MVVVIQPDENERAVLERVFRHAEVSPVRMVSSAQEALEMLVLCANPILPRLLMLDVGSIIQDAAETVRAIRASEHAAWVPIVCLAEAESTKRIHPLYEEGANAVVRKPMGYLEYVEAMTAVCQFWLRLAIPPDESRPC